MMSSKAPSSITKRLDFSKSAEFPRSPMLNLSHSGTSISTLHRETAVVIKLNNNFGKVKCHSRNVELNFLTKDVVGSGSSTLQCGDVVEYTLHYDHDSGRPTARHIVKKSTSTQLIPGHRLFGCINRLAVKSYRGSGDSNPDSEWGEVVFELAGNLYFLPYHFSECFESETLMLRDQVSFQMDQRASDQFPRAISVRREIAPLQPSYQGIISSLKTTFGFIERADTGEEVFFHYSQVKNLNGPLRCGDLVDFSMEVNSRQLGSSNGYMATNVTILPPGSLQIEKILPPTLRGTVLRTQRGHHMINKEVAPLNDQHQLAKVMDGVVITEPSIGCILAYEFRQRDVVGDFTLLPGDIVIFQVAVECRRDHERATNIQLLPETFGFNREARYTGRVVSVANSSSATMDYGFIRCAQTLAKVFFRFAESLDPLWKPAFHDECEFSLIPGDQAYYPGTFPPSPTQFQDSKTPVAIRIRPLPKGSVNFQGTSATKHSGIVVRTPLPNPTNNLSVVGLISCANKSPSGNLIVEYENDGLAVGCQRKPRVGDPVCFKVTTSPSLRREIAVEISIEAPRAEPSLTATNLSTAVADKPLNSDEPQIEQGYIATLKDSYGFIELASHEREIFFHFSSFCGGDSLTLEIGDEVQFVAVRKNNRQAAYQVTRLPKGTVNPEVILNNQIFYGKIVRPLRLVNPQQEHYAGVIEMLDQNIANESESGRTSTSERDAEENKENIAPDGAGDCLSPQTFEYGVTGLADPCDYLQIGDKVSFKLATVLSTGQLRATAVTGLRAYLRARVHCLKHLFGFLDFDVPSSQATPSKSSPPTTPPSPGSSSGRKLFFHLSEVQGRVDLQVGDMVEFVLIRNQSNGRYAACSIRKVEEALSKSTSGASSAASTAPNTPVYRSNFIRRAHNRRGQRGFANE